MQTAELEGLLSQMTREEKVTQLLQLAAGFYIDLDAVTGPIEEMGLTEKMIENAGTVLGISGAEDVIRTQKSYLEKNRLGIPLIFMADVIHGYKTIFPIPLALGSSWNTELAEETARIAALESAVSGLHVTFSPMVDLVRDPRWGRVMESTGEDAFLNAELAKAFVRGYQGTDLKNDLERVAACVKHFAAYGAPIAGREYNTVNMSERQLRESYLPGYKAALDEGAKLVMTAFNTVDGVPATANKWLMRDLLRNEWNFNGVLISDWGAVKELVPHGVAADEKEAAILALNASVDIEMMTMCYMDTLEASIEAGEIEEALVDEAVLRILNLKNDLGLFENPYRGADAEKEKAVVLSEEHRSLARKAAEESIVLLKNEGVLPLKQNQKIALIGPGAGSKDILVAWSWQGESEKAISLAEGLAQHVPAEQLLIAKGCDILSGTQAEMDAAVAVAKKADVIVLALGENSDMSGEAASRSDIRLPKIQLELLAQLKSVGKPIIVTLFNGRPLDIHELEVAGIVEAWFPGTEGGAALANILMGAVNPSAKLSMSFPYNVGQVPVYYNPDNTGRPELGRSVDEKYVSKYLDSPNEALYPFGFGLSYTSFSYSDMTLSTTELNNSETLTVEVTVKNSGKYAGKEIVQLYLRDSVGEVVRPVKELKGYQKIELAAGAEKTVRFTVTEEQLRYVHQDCSFSSDSGAFEVMVGTSSAEVQSARFKLIK
ncbi:beta-glucosidase [Carnobacterium maltaromaticum]|nr:beta-glucosidase [Carnobacterium maltaromaticum]PLS33481.1 beta-glucosidase [Carnobacterium maltaromaticum]PLS33591.1 beta-glucosidase [Carnobacterium maltaromaticum]PLS41374.1 beta-glucosidase [Carnobacterium maltaromaticum]PLS42172.1 beta-glucosidase [Carnobacterium maltaromaticum]